MPSKTQVMITVMLVGSLSAVSVQGFFQQQEAELVGSMPEDEGKELVSTLCASCHSLERTLTRRVSQEEWEKTVNDMVTRGAQIFTEEAETIISYLAKHYGPGEAVASNTLGSPGGDLLTRKCFQCHGDGTWRDLRLDLRGWTGVLYRMVGRGALWTEEEIAGMAEYLAQANGPESAEAPQM